MHMLARLDVLPGDSNDLIVAPYRLAGGNAPGRDLVLSARRKSRRQPHHLAETREPNHGDDTHDLQASR